MPFPKRFYITALGTESKCIQCILKRSAVHTFDLSSGREDYFSCLYLLLLLDRTVCFYHTSKPHMRSGAYHRIVIHNCSAVDKRRPIHMGMRIHYRALHNKTSRSQNRTWTHNCRRMHDRWHFISCLQQFVCPE